MPDQQPWQHLLENRRKGEVIDVSQVPLHFPIHAGAIYERITKGSVECVRNGPNGFIEVVRPWIKQICNPRARRRPDRLDSKCHWQYITLMVVEHWRQWAQPSSLYHPPCLISGSKAGCTTSAHSPGVSPQWLETFLIFFLFL